MKRRISTAIAFAVFAIATTAFACDDAGRNDARAPADESKNASVGNAMPDKAVVVSKQSTTTNGAKKAVAKLDKPMVAKATARTGV